MIHKLISSNTVIAKVISDLDLKEDDIRISSIREWIGEAIEKIGAIQQFTHKVTNIPLIKHQALLPCDLHHLEQVAYSPSEGLTWLPMRMSTGNFDVWGECSSSCDCLDEDYPIQQEAIIILAKNLYNLTSDEEALSLLNSNETIKQTLTTVAKGLYNPISYGKGLSSTTPTNELVYAIKPGYIMSNIPYGVLKLSYYAIPTDKDGYPMVPDNAAYLEAIYWYITLKLLYPKKLRGEINRYDYNDIQTNWNYYSNQAYGNAMLPNADGMEAIKNTWLKFMPEIDDHANFFSHTGDRQYIYNQN